MQWLWKSLSLLGRALIGYVLLFLLLGVRRLFSAEVAFSMQQLVGLLIPIAAILVVWLIHLHAVWQHRSAR